MGLVWYLYLSEPPLSHLETALSLTCSRSASYRCVIPFSVRSIQSSFPVLSLSIFLPLSLSIIPALRKSTIDAL